MRLDIYDKETLVKTYKTDEYLLKFGTVKEFVKIVNLDELKSASEEDIEILVLKAIPRSMGLISHLMKDVFKGLTDDELENTRVKDIVIVIIDIIKFATKEMSIGANSKN